MPVGRAYVKGTQISIKHFSVQSAVEGIPVPICFVLLGMGHPLCRRLIVLNIYPGFAIRHRQGLVVVLDCLRMEALDETFHVMLFRARLRAHQAAHRQRRRGGRFGAVTAVRARDDLGLAPEADFARRLIA